MDDDLLAVERDALLNRQRALEAEWERLAAQPFDVAAYIEYRRRLSAHVADVAPYQRRLNRLQTTTEDNPSRQRALALIAGHRMLH